VAVAHASVASPPLFHAGRTRYHGACLCLPRSSTAPLSPIGALPSLYRVACHPNRTRPPHCSHRHASFKKCRVPASPISFPRTPFLLPPGCARSPHCSLPPLLHTGTKVNHRRHRSRSRHHCNYTLSVSPLHDSPPPFDFKAPHHLLPPRCSRITLSPARTTGTPPPTGNTTAEAPLSRLTIARPYGEFHRPTCCLAGAPLLLDARSVDLVGWQASSEPHRLRHRERAVHGDGHGRAHAVPPAWAGQLVFPVGLDWRNEAVGWTVAQHCYSIFPFSQIHFRLKFSDICLRF
jgi:hypothetical protein